MGEKKEIIKELTVNHLPVLTWNHLKVNNSKITLPQALDQELDAVEIKGLVQDGVSVTETGMLTKDIPTGMGEEAFEFVQTNTKSQTKYTIGEHKKIADPVVILKTLKKDWLDQISVEAKANSEVTVILSYEALEEAKGLHGNAILLELEEYANVHLFIVQLLNQQYEHFTNIGARLKDHASFDLTYVGIGAKRFWVGCEVALEGRESNCKIDTSYLGGKDKEMDFNLVARHYGKKSESSIKGNGVLTQNSKKIMRGTIDFIKGAKGAVGSESEQVLMLSKDSVNKSIPLILCGEDDVDGRHGASIGNINPSQLFYLNSRGISKKEAHKMFAASIVERMKNSVADESIKEHLAEVGGKYLEQLI